MMLAWLSSSEKTTSPRPASAATVARVRQVAGAEQQRRLRALELGEPLLERRCGRHRPRDQPRGAGAGAVALARRRPAAARTCGWSASPR